MEGPRKPGANTPSGASAASAAADAGVLRFRPERGLTRRLLPLPPLGPAPPAGYEMAMGT